MTKSSGTTDPTGERGGSSFALVPQSESPELPVPSAGDVSVVLATASAVAARGVAGAMATVLERHGSAPGTPGQKLYVSADGACVGTVGGGAVEREVLTSLIAVARDPAKGHEVRSFKLGPELGMC